MTDINQISDNISKWLEQTLTPDRMQTVQDFISDRFNEVVQHKISLYLDYLGITKDNIIQHLNSPMPDVWNETTGKAVEQLIRTLGG
jgi:hypothetical protein